MIGRYDAEKGVICLEMTPEEALKSLCGLSSEWTNKSTEALLRGVEQFREHEALAALRGPGEPYVHLSPREESAEKTVVPVDEFGGARVVFNTDGSVDLFGTIALNMESEK
jgi:hypothetical protein